MSTKKYVSLDKLSVFLNNLKNTFALKSHKHPVDSALSDTSENPVQNKVVNAEFDAIAEGMGALEVVIDDALVNKKNKDLMVTSTDSTMKTSTISTSEINEAINDGTTVYFHAGGTNFQYLEGNENSAVFYNNYYDNDVMQADVFVIEGTSIVEHEHFQRNIITQSDINTAVNNLKNDLLNGVGTVAKAEEATHATSADSAATATKATQDGAGKVITSTYETKTDAAAKLEEAKEYATNAANTVKNDLLNGAGAAYDTLKELGDLIDDNQDAIGALQTVAADKAPKIHSHVISDIEDFEEITSTEIQELFN